MFSPFFLTLCRNLHSTGRVSLPSFCSTMWVRLSRDTFSLQLHTAEPWIREFWGSEAKKKRGSPKMSFMIGLAEMRESARMNVFTSFSCLSKCCGGEDDKRGHLLYAVLLQYNQAALVHRIGPCICSLSEHNQMHFLPSAEV